MIVGDIFDLREFVSEVTFTRHKYRSTQFLDPRLVHLAKGVSDYFGRKVVLNTWHLGGDFHEQGYVWRRASMNSGDFQHRCGRAMNFRVDGMESGEVYSAIVAASPVFAKMGATVVEAWRDGDDDVHLDVRWTGTDKLLILTPRPKWTGIGSAVDTYDRWEILR